MLHAKKHVRGEAGFTLVELMVVMLVLGILIALALPFFISARERAQNRAAQASLKDALVAAKVVFSDHDSYTTAIFSQLQTEEGSLVFRDSTVDSAGPKEVSVDVIDSTHWVAAALSASGHCYAIKDSALAGTTFAKDIGGGCSADNAATTGIFTGSW